MSNEKRAKLIAQRNAEWEMKKQKLMDLDRLNRTATPGPWIPKDLSQAFKQNEDIRLVIELRNSADMLISDSRSRQHTEEWYAVRLELLRALCEEKGVLSEYCNIVANGILDVNAPPTYQQQMSYLKYELEKALAKADYWQTKYDEILLKGLAPPKP